MLRTVPRAHRLKVEGGLFHLTHRCHNRAFLLKFARDRDAYRAKLRQKLKRFEVSLLDYCLTCNREWEWQGYHEIMGNRRRYRLLDLERLCWRFGTDSIEDVRRNLDATLQEAIARDQLRREPCWTDSLAVGSRTFIDQVQPLILSRRETEIVEDKQLGLWALKEPEIPYGSELGSKTRSKAAK